MVPGKYPISALSIVLLSLVWPSAEHLTACPDHVLALVLAVVGIAGFAATSAAAATGATGATDRQWGLLRGAALAGLVLLTTGASSIVLRRVAWQLHEISLPLPETMSRGWPSRLAFVPDLLAGRLTVWTGECAETVRLTHEALGLYVVWYLMMAVGVLSLLWVWHRGRLAAARTMTGSVASILIYAVFRSGVLIALAVEFGKPGLLWQHAYTVASWLPLALVLRHPNASCKVPPAPGVARPGDPATARGTPLAGRRRWLGRIGAAVPPVLAGLCLAFAAAYNDPGLPKQGRVVIDGSHSDWEWTQERFDAMAFGIRAEYNYYCLSEYLGHFYKVTTVSAAAAQPLGTTLETADVLVIKTPTRFYSDSEINAIVKFVERGGGLLLIGDHTNLFGMSTYLNSIASRFGMRFRFDDTFDLETTAFSTYRRPQIWFHPAVRSVPAFEFLTSCTIEGGPGTEPVMIGCGIGSEEVDYGHPNFFGDIAYQLGDRFGLFLQAAAKRFGKGRVLLFTDSTCFSNFCMFSPGKPEAARGFIDYLNRRGERYPHLRLGGLGLACALIGLSVAAGRMRRRAGARHQAVLLVLGAGFAFPLGTAAISRLNASLYGPVEERTPLATIVFETGHCGASFFDYMGVSALGSRQRFEELYMCAQRLGLHPRAGSLGDLGKRLPLGVVIVNPIREFSKDEVGEIERLVSAGGVLLVMDGGGAGGSTANQILRPFGVESHAVPAMMRPVSVRHAGGMGEAGRAEGRSNPEGIGSADFYPTLTLFGVGVQCLGDPPIANAFTKNFGKGRVVVCLNSYRYSEAVVGRPLERTQPSADVAAIYREVFAILDFGRANRLAGLID